MENLYLIFENLYMKFSAVLIFVMAIKLIFKNKLSARAHFMIWLLPLISLIFCIGNIEIRTNTSIYTALPAPAQLSFKPILCGIWLCVAAVLAMWHIVSYIIYMRKIRTLPVTDTPQLPRLRELTEIPESRRLTLRIGTNAQTVSGTIILPENFSDEEKYHILLHELCHFAHYDNIKLWAALAIVCINWFNPIVWAAFKLFCTDIEMLCDERVLKITDKKREYAQVLVKSSAMRSGFVPGAVSAAGGRRAVFARIKRIVNFRHMKPVWLIAAVLGCGIIAAVCLTVPKEKEPIIIYREIPTASPEIIIVQNPEADERISVEENAMAPTDIIIEAPTAAPAPPAASGNVSSRPKPVRENPPVRQSANENITSQENIVVYDAPSEGTRESVSGNGTKETYRLDDGTQAVVQYDDGEVKNRYIIVE